MLDALLPLRRLALQQRRRQRIKLALAGIATVLLGVAIGAVGATYAVTLLSAL